MQFLTKNEFFGSGRFWSSRLPKIAIFKNRSPRWFEFINFDRLSISWSSKSLFADFCQFAVCENFEGHYCRKSRFSTISHRDNWVDQFRPADRLQIDSLLVKITFCRFLSICSLGRLSMSWLPESRFLEIDRRVDLRDQFRPADRRQIDFVVRQNHFLPIFINLRFWRISILVFQNWIFLRSD